VRTQQESEMMNLTKQLMGWLIANMDVAADATDDEFRSAAGKAFASGKLTAEKYTELSTTKEVAEANEFAQRLDRIANGLEAVVNKLTIPIETKEVVKEDETTGTKEVKAGNPGAISKMVSDMGGTPTGSNPRVKSPTEQYSTTKSALHYPTKTHKGNGHTMAGQRVSLYGRDMDAPSDLDKALSGVWAKFQIMSVTPKIAGSAQRAFELMSEHEKGLLAHLADSEMWDDSKDNKDRMRKGYPGGVKALIDDSTSGGLEAAPIVFDDQVIQTPLLYGELFPLVNTIPLDRGRRVEGVALGQVTSSWGGVDDSAVTLFTTTSYVAAFDTTIYRWQGAIRLGLDFLSDTPIDFNQHVTTQYGNQLLNDLDDVIATGNGTTQPEGIMNKAATTSVAFGGTTTLAAYESLRFSVTKAEHRGVASSAVFCGTEASYQHAMGVPVGASDVRRLTNTISMPNYDGYTWMNRPYKINESLTNPQIFYAIMARYRMYRRKGLAVRTSTEGDTLIRNNELLIVAMARYGGQLERAACAAITTTAEA
jgi:HK97 family phage major capsid protein